MRIKYPSPRDNVTDAAAEERAREIDGLPTVGGKQAVGRARIKKPGEPAINRWRFADGSELVTDDDGNPTDWPEV